MYGTRQEYVITIIKHSIMSVLRGDKLRPSMQPKLGHLLILHACIYNLKNTHLILSELQANIKLQTKEV